MPNHLNRHVARWSLAIATLCAASPLAAQAQAAATRPDEPAPSFSAEFLRNETVIAAGREVWQQQCRHCHGSSAYPGKAPKLRPGSMEPDFVFDRVTYGFKGMPPWRDVFTREQRLAVVAYIKSDSFSP